MIKSMTNESEHIATPQLVEQAVEGDSRAWERLMIDNRARLRRMVAIRLDRRLQGRIDPSDIIQEAFIDAARRLSEYAQAPSMPFFIWLRQLTGQRLIEQHRYHLRTQARDASRDVSIYNGQFPEATTADLAANLLGEFTSPSQAVIRIEQNRRLQKALDSLDPMDREILVLRHFEQLTNGEASKALNLDKSATSKRYVRAMERLKGVLTAMPGSREDLPS
jgi:RNA polymerase sigma-70 factor (ECF subfamily)